VIVYDNRFNANEWFIILGLCVGVALMLTFPKRFSGQVTVVFFVCGVYSGFFFDHSLSVQPVSFYDVNDVSEFQVMDFISYWMFGAVSYFFFYIYDRVQPKPSYIPLFILGWTLMSLGAEWVAGLCGVYHYSHGYKLIYSFPIYLIVQSCWMALYHGFKGKGFV
jgi:hypothetical protein